jgi:hypothetical protein
LSAIPDPWKVRAEIGRRYHEIAVLKRLLRAAETRDHLLTPPATVPGVREEATRG